MKTSTSFLQAQEQSSSSMVMEKTATTRCHNTCNKDTVVADLRIVNTSLYAGDSTSLIDRVHAVR